MAHRSCSPLLCLSSAAGVSEAGFIRWQRWREFGSGWKHLGCVWCWGRARMLLQIVTACYDLYSWHGDCAAVPDRTRFPPGGLRIKTSHNREARTCGARRGPVHGTDVRNHQWLSLAKRASPTSDPSQEVLSCRECMLKAVDTRRS